MPDLEKIADELYQLPPEEFTAARTQYEKEARRAGDGELAALVRGLAKPTATAWLANQLVREYRHEVLALLKLGAELRGATQALAGDQLRALSRQQHELVNGLVQQARGLATAAGRSVSDDAARGLDDTLRAAAADERAAALLLGGQLPDALHAADFGTGFGVPGEAVDLAPVLQAKLTKPERPPRDEQHQRAEHDLVEAGRALAHAKSALESAQAAAASADQAAADAHERVDELRQQLADATRAASEADRFRGEQAGALQQAERAVAAAERTRDEAQERRDRLSN